MKTSFEKTDWFRQAEYGFFLHFLNTGKHSFVPTHTHKNRQSPAEWNETVNSFDVEKFAQQFHELNAGFVWLTVGQNSGFYCAPNNHYDKFMGLSGANSKCSNRDLVSDLSEALKKYDIPLLVYTTTLAPGFDYDAVQNLKSIPPWNCNANCGNYEDVKQYAGKDSRLKDFMRMWSDIHQEWSIRWQDKIKGWWVDGCYFTKEMYEFDDEPNGISFTNALRSGNPNSIVALNPGAFANPMRCYDDSPEDYISGEINNPQYAHVDGPMQEGLQSHILSYVGETWGGSTLRTDGKGFAQMTRNVVDNGGILNWDIPLTTSGISDEVFAVLKDFANIYAESKNALPKTHVKITPPICAEDGVLVDGVVEFSSEKATDLTLSWLEENMTSTNRMARMILKAPQKNVTNKLYMTSNGFTKEHLVNMDRRFKVNEQLSEPVMIMNANNVIGECQFAIVDNSLRVLSKVEESMLLQGERPWGSSGLEIFLSTDRLRHVQYCAGGNGKICNVYRAVISGVEGAKVEASNDGKITTIDTYIPLEDQFRNGAFFMNIKQQVHIDGKLVTCYPFEVTDPSYFVEVICD